MRDRIIKFKSKEPTVSHVYFNLFDCLPHAFDSIQVLNKRYLNKRNRINTWSTHSVGISITDEIIDECPVNSFVNKS